MVKQEAYLEYEKILSGQRQNFPPHFFNDSEIRNRENAIAIVKYALCDILGWGPDVIIKSLDKRVIRDLKLDTVLPYIKIPDEFAGDIDGRFFAHLIYPDRYHYNSDDLTIEIYKRLISGRKKGIPKNFFKDEAGRHRARLCFSYALRNLFTFSSIEEVYETFYEIKGKSFLSSAMLTGAVEEFDTPLDLLHESLADTQKDDFLFHYYKFKYCYRKEKML